jgi:hypothetical protein
MELDGVTYVGPPVDDWPLLDEVPEELAAGPTWCCSSALVPSIITG